MAPPSIAVVSKYQRLFKLIALFYVLWQLRKMIRALRRLSYSKHSQFRYRDPMMTPASRLFPQFFESVNKNGLWIFHRDWVIPSELKLKLNLQQPKGVVILSHGLAEHIQRYEHIAQQLNAAGFACYGIDHQGHGMSDGDRSYVEKFEHYVNDLLVFSHTVAEDYKEYEIPMFLFGHSMGGLIATYTALKAQENAKKLYHKTSGSGGGSDKKFLFDGGVILSSPFFGVAPEADIGSQYSVIDKSLRFLSRSVPKLQCIALNNKGLSHDPKILYRLQRDPLHHNDMVCIRTVQEMVDAANALIADKKCKEVEWPYLLFGGGDDPLCDPNKWKTFHDATLSEDKELTVFQGLYHECLNETEAHQKTVATKVIGWLEQRVQIHEYEKTQSRTQNKKSTIMNVMQHNTNNQNQSNNDNNNRMQSTAVAFDGD